MLLAKCIHINMDKNKRPKLYTLPDTLPALQRPAAGMICPARPVWYRVQTGAACPAFGRVCRSLRGLPCIWRGLSCRLSCAGRPGALGGAGSHRRGI